MDALKLFLNIGQTLKIIRSSPGEVQLKFSLNSLPLIKQLSVVSPFNQITVDQFIASLNGINNIKVNQFLARATIQYDSTIWKNDMWTCFCNGQENSELMQQISHAIKDNTK